MSKVTLDVTFLPGAPTVPYRLPLRGQRPILWEAMLGTVNARNEDSGTHYFDYRYEEALAWSRIEEREDVRAYRVTPALLRDRPWLLNYGLRQGQMVVWA